MFKQNIGTMNAFIRITIGLVLLSCNTAKLARRPWCIWSKIMLWVGAMRIAEGIVRFCPIVAACKLGKFMNIPDLKMPGMDLMKNGQSNKQEAHHTSHDEEKTSSGSYDASDKEIESALEKALMSKPL
ncbi:YgaP family membrane protein [Bacillus rhizoplanae]|uniref:YgaP family membrane protein n=1 Tax=Bacillus TaxID=1386 RepID=UPI003D196596